MLFSMDFAKFKLNILLPYSMDAFFCILRPGPDIFTTTTYILIDIIKNTDMYNSTNPWHHCLILTEVIKGRPAALDVCKGTIKQSCRDM